MSNSPTFDPLIQSEDIAFKPEEMRTCSACQRSNAPNRISCLYCGTDLGIPPDNGLPVKIKLRKLEPWERGFNIIFRQHEVDRPEVAAAAEIVSRAAAPF